MSSRLRLGLVGRGIAHSLSPTLHHAAGESVGQQIHYALIDVEAEALGGVCNSMVAGDWDGLNVTAPYKRWAYEQMHSVGPCAARLGVVNTIRFDSGGAWVGHNTDRLGFEGLLGDLRCPRPLILGAGGAARAVIDVLAAVTHEPLRIFNRSVDRVRALAEVAPNGVKALPLSAVPEHLGDARLVINCLPASLSGWLCSLPFQRMAAVGQVIDLSYGVKADPLATHVATCSRGYRDGLEMLIGQGVAAFELWTGETPDVDHVRRAVRCALEDASL